MWQFFISLIKIAKVMAMMKKVVGRLMGGLAPDCDSTMKCAFKKGVNIKKALSPDG